MFFCRKIATSFFKTAPFYLKLLYQKIRTCNENYAHIL